MIYKTIQIEILYRDADNYKDYFTAYFSNNDNIDEKIITEKIDTLIEQCEEEGIFAPYYNIPNFAPIDNPFFPVSDSDPNHSFTEIIAVDCNDDIINNYDGDISEVLKSIDDPSIQKKLEKKYKKEMIKYLEGIIKRLTPLPMPAVVLSSPRKRGS